MVSCPKPDPVSKVRTFVANRLRIVVSTLTYSGPPGKPGPVPPIVYICPQGDYTFRRRVAGEPVPECPNHHVPLLPVVHNSPMVTKFFEGLGGKLADQWSLATLFRR